MDTDQQMTAKQRQLLDAFERANRPMTAHDAWKRVGTAKMGQATVYRAIARLVELGHLAPVEIHGAVPMWESAGKAHHHHFYCTACGGVFELEGCAGNLKSLLPRGFTMERHSITIYGRCSACSTV